MLSFDTVALSNIGRSQDAPVDPIVNASKNAVEFCYDYKISPSAILQGRDFAQCFEKNLFIKIKTPTCTDVAYRPANEGHKAIYNRQYQAFLAKHEAELKGTPLSEVKEFKSILRTAYPFGIFTIEALAAFSRRDIVEGEGLDLWVKAAKLYLAKKSMMTKTKIEDINSSDKLTAQIANRHKKRGRPPKRLANADDNQADNQ